MQAGQAHILADGRRLHLNHGPIDLIIEAFGEALEVRRAYQQANARFATVLGELVEELALLRRPAGTAAPRAFRGTVAIRMETAVQPHAARFITPMAAVAGSVADEIMAAMLDGRLLDRAYVNNGGDIALHLAPGQALNLAIAGTGNGFADRVIVRADDAVRGVATSGWRGRSHSLGIADAVTVLARDAAAADAAATMIANAIDLPGHPAVERIAACRLAPDSDLAARLVTTAVGVLAAAEIELALERGLAVADDFCRRGLIMAAALFLNGESRACGDVLQEKVISYVAPLCAAGHLPQKGGPSSSLRPITSVAAKTATLKPPISPLLGEMSGRTEGGSVKSFPSNKLEISGRLHA